MNAGKRYTISLFRLKLLLLDLNLLYEFRQMYFVFIHYRTYEGCFSEFDVCKDHVHITTTQGLLDKHTPTLDKIHVAIATVLGHFKTAP